MKHFDSRILLYVTTVKFGQHINHNPQCNRSTLVPFMQNVYLYYLDSLDTENEAVCRCRGYDVDLCSGGLHFELRSIRYPSSNP
jgi:hypothetical protein